ncbi:unnamed protein product [Allacma fusca]|uniref:Thioredoxin domain-containing protein n=1 Tax=Allacma fusca TaxID=39272 RepID=A0A8J2PEX2_9HEXA|nr:unnamed protein product [Allacma fusca]
MLAVELSYYFYISSILREDRDCNRIFSMVLASSFRQSFRVLQNTHHFRPAAFQGRSLQALVINNPYEKLFHTSQCQQDIYNVQDEEDFKTKVINSTKPVVVEFHAEWCGPCKQLMPRLEKIIASLKDDPVDLAKVNIDDLPDLAMEYNVGAVPSVLGLNNDTLGI